MNVNKKKFVFIIKPYTSYVITVTTVENNKINISIPYEPSFEKITIENTNFLQTNYFSDVLKKLVISCEYLFHNFNIMIREQPVKIKQIYMNKDLKITFMEDMIRMYDLREYDNDYEPAIFYGLMSKADILVLERNKSLKVIVWIGGDINYKINRTPKIANLIKTQVDRIIKVPKVKHISISSFITKSLTDLKLQYKFVPFMGINFSRYKPIVKGPCIYLYTAVSNEKYYGSDLYTKLIEKYKNIKFIIACCLLSYKYYENNPSKKN